ncbi:MAG: hypothetical protein R3C56_14260 [Pirellulaceae bacterium]
MIERFLSDLRKHIRPLAFAKWHHLDGGVEFGLMPAGHVLGSAIVEVEHEGNDLCSVVTLAVAINRC